MPEYSFVANRELRVIPKGWDHPKDAKGRFIPHLSHSDYFGLIDSLEPDEPRPKLPPMPEVAGLTAEDTEIAAYETTTEGTPISPAFPNTPEGRLAVVNHCARHATTFGNHKADAEAWAAILLGEAALVSQDGSISFA